jgi:beta-glucosidase
MKEKAQIKFPEGFLWGTSTSAYQIEGGIENDWKVWEMSKKRRMDLVRHGEQLYNYVCDKASDSYNRYEEDFDLAKSMNNNSIRFGIEWARIEPKKGVWNVDEIEHYRKVLEAAKSRGLKVVLTLWHWTNPVWLAEEKGWAGKSAVECYSNYVDLVIKEFGVYVDYWVTLNEPMVHVVNGYLTKKFPPNKRKPIQAIKVFNNLVQAHNNAYDQIHDHFPEAKVSITKLTNNFERAHKWNLIEIVLEKIFHWYWNDRFLKKISKHLDYIGLDYYFHDRIVWYPPFKKNINKETTDMGWEIYPKGIYNVLKYLDKYKLPIIILENGLADSVDRHRRDFIIDHLLYVHKAIEEGVDVRGYFHWSLIDNFEWAAGFKPKFGLHKVDRSTMERIARPSAEEYAKICKDNGIKE